MMRSTLLGFLQSLAVIASVVAFGLAFGYVGSCAAGARAESYCRNTMDYAACVAAREN